MPKPLHVSCALIAGLAAGYGIAQWRGPGAPAAASVPGAAKQVNDHGLLDEVAERVRTEYVDPVVNGKLEQAAVAGMVASLDPHSALRTEEYDEMRISTAGSYTGVGIEVAADEDRVVVVSPIEGSPAATAGVRSGDVILAIDGQPVTSDSLDHTIDRMRGRAGSRVRLAIGREGEAKPLEFDLQRSEVHVRTVRSEPLPGTTVTCASRSSATRRRPTSISP